MMYEKHKHAPRSQSNKIIGQDIVEFRIFSRRFYFWNFRIWWWWCWSSSSSPTVFHCHINQTSFFLHTHILIDITTYATGFNKSTYSSFLLLFFRKHHWICFQYSRVINKIFFSWIISHGFSIWNVKCKEFKFNLSGK